VKANLKHPQLAAMKRGGITIIQPGIESFSSEVLNLMKKGVSGAQNVQLLKWSEEIGIQPAWNLLAGFPGESPAEYARMAELIPLLTHLEPPTGCSRIRLDRFSPLFNKSGEVGITRVRPTLAYYYIFPLGRRELARLSYFFDFDYADGRKPETYIVGVQNEVTKWRNARFQTDATKRPRLDATLHEDGTVHVSDTRECAIAGEHWLNGLSAELLLACDTAHTRNALESRFATEYTSDAVGQVIAKLMGAKLLAPIENVFLSLPVIRNRTPQTLETERNVDRLIPPAAKPEPLLRVL
jgi:ribosomal peptide maturation radical SAM protein 1